MPYIYIFQLYPNFNLKRIIYIYMANFIIFRFDTLYTYIYIQTLSKFQF